MRRLRRPNIVPETLREDGSGGKRHARNVHAWLEGKPNEINDDNGASNRPDVRGALHAMQGFACAYCQRQLDENRGEVDHFRPKSGRKSAGHSGYWWVAYSFENYFLACGSCNGPLCKSDQFPLEDPQARAKPLDEDSLSRERPLLLNPVVDPVDRWMRVEWRDHNNEGSILPARRAEEDAAIFDRVNLSIEVFRLNKNTYLLGERARYIRAVSDAITEDDKSEAQRLACRYLPHGAVGYQLVRELKRAWLPSAREELLIFMATLAQELRAILANLHAITDDPHNEKIRNELFWALAVLWKDPPPDSLTADEFSTWLDANLPGVKASIENYRNSL